VTEAARHSWKDIRDLINGRILDQTFAPGDKLPKDEDLAEELGCSRATVQRAMQDLSDSGIVERRRKGGTTVRADPVTRATLDIPIARKEVEQKGSTYGYQAVRRTLTETPLPIAARFGLSAPEKMLRIEALHLADRRPYIYEDRWISTRTVPEILDVDLEVNSANEWLVHNKPYSRCDIRLYAIKANAYYAELLDTEENEALFVTERTTWIGDDPITTVISVAAPGYQLLTTI
jgi:GntR family histidine utilization transcriptional repressor